MGDFDSKFSFILMEKKSHTVNQLQLDALEVEENFTFVGKLRGKIDPRKTKREKKKSIFNFMFLSLNRVLITDM